MTQSTQPTARRRWWLISLTTLLALMQAGAVWRALNPPPVMTAATRLSPLLEFGAGIGWALLFAAITVNLLRKRGARPGVLVVSAFLLYSTLRLLLFVQADYDHHRLPLLAVVSLCLLVFPAVALLRR
ncbi:MAG: hypothetical protein K8J31_19120 [Anaerolineae bacterium]|nr:hypothetical protein [Anaerolineae bacterium]